ncbi:MAG: pyruvate kinase, partial [Cytophagales bacterium]|nr:pyruvate kinase [Cytophagales bacterium]
MNSCTSTDGNIPIETTTAMSTDTMAEAQTQSIHSLIQYLETLQTQGEELARKFQHFQFHESFEESRANLLRYFNLRQSDITWQQERLSDLGITSLGRIESHVQASLNSVLIHLNLLNQDRGPLRQLSEHFTSQNLIIDRHTEGLLGKEPEGRNVRIMVTLPSEAANNYTLIYAMLQEGVNCFRINCAHDSPAEWKQMIDHIHQAKTELGKSCKIAMDLAGPKLRTGEIEKGPEVLRIRTAKDQFGRVTDPTRLRLSLPKSPPATNHYHIPLRQEYLNLIEV